MTLKEDACAVIPAAIKRIMACYLLAQTVAFAMEPLPEGRYLIRVSGDVLPRLQTEVARVLARGVVDDDDAMAWFRYRGALISYIERQPGYTAEYHYRYEVTGMGSPKQFDIRDLETFTKGMNHEAAIRCALDRGAFHPDASFLYEPFYELWERL